LNHSNREEKQIKNEIVEEYLNHVLNEYKSADGVWEISKIKKLEGEVINILDLYR
jgi:hypothetical protein